MEKETILLLVLIILILNLVWEFSHSKLYTDLTGIPRTLHLITASFSDVFWIFLIFIPISLINKSLEWIINPGGKEYILIIFFGLIIAILIEIINLNLGRWAYKDLMPTLFGIGISPLLQLATTGVLSLLILKKFNP